MIRYRKNFFLKHSLLLICLLTLSVFIYASSPSIEFEEVAPGIFVHQGEHLDVDETLPWRHCKHWLHCWRRINCRH